MYNCIRATTVFLLSFYSNPTIKYRIKTFFKQKPIEIYSATATKATQRSSLHINSHNSNQFGIDPVEIFNQEESNTDSNKKIEQASQTTTYFDQAYNSINQLVGSNICIKKKHQADNNNFETVRQEKTVSKATATQNHFERLPKDLFFILFPYIYTTQDVINDIENEKNTIYENIFYVNKSFQKNLIQAVHEKKLFPSIHRILNVFSKNLSFDTFYPLYYIAYHPVSIIKKLPPQTTNVLYELKQNISQSICFFDKDEQLNEQLVSKANLLIKYSATYIKQPFNEASAKQFIYKITIYATMGFFSKFLLYIIFRNNEHNYLGMYLLL